MSLGPTTSGEIFALPMNSSLEYDGYFRDYAPFPQDFGEFRPSESCMILPAPFQDSVQPNTYWTSSYEAPITLNIDEVTLLSPRYSMQMNDHAAFSPQDLLRNTELQNPGQELNTDSSQPIFESSQTSPSFGEESKDSSMSLLNRPATYKAQPGVKVDHGMKLFIRNWRDALIALFDQSGLSVGLHHWKIDRWYKEAQRFALHTLGYELNDKELNGLIMLLYSAFGATAKKYGEMKKEDQLKLKPSEQDKLRIYKGLGKDRKHKLLVYHTIFSNNNREMRDFFFSDEVVRAFWPHVRPLITKKLCFCKKGVDTAPSPSIIPSFRAVTRVIKNEYKLPMPAWWEAMF